MSLAQGHMANLVREQCLDKLRAQLVIEGTMAENTISAKATGLQNAVLTDKRRHISATRNLAKSLNE
jgi:hypothetical protein